jgi:hypothetical protein
VSAGMARPILVRSPRTSENRDYDLSSKERFTSLAIYGNGTVIYILHEIGYIRPHRASNDAVSHLRTFRPCAWHARHSKHRKPVTPI